MIIAKLDMTEMPPSCAYCRYALRSILKITCDIAKIDGDITKRPDNCPLTEVEDVKESLWSCDRLQCMLNENNGIGCDECQVTKHNKEIAE